MSYSPAYPLSQDVLANPTNLTNRDDPGFELHGVISRIQDILEALEAKVGITASLPVAGGGVLRQTGAGASAWGKAQTADVGTGQITAPLLGTNAGGQVWSVAASSAFSTTTIGWGYDSAGAAVSFTLAKAAQVFAIFTGTFFIDAVAGSGARFGINHAPTAGVIGSHLLLFPAINVPETVAVQSYESLAAGSYQYQLAVYCIANGFNCKWQADGVRNLTVVALY